MRTGRLGVGGVADVSRGLAWRLPRRTLVFKVTERHGNDVGKGVKIDRKGMDGNGSGNGRGLLKHSRREK